MAKNNKNKEIFIEEVLTLVTKENGPTLSDEAWAFFEELRNGKESDGKLTETGAKILSWIHDNTTKDNIIFSPAAIGEGLFITPRSVSGAARKLVNDGYLYKEGKAPVSYGITQAGCQVLSERESN
jgi:hypothetical protein